MLARFAYTCRKAQISSLKLYMLDMSFAHIAKPFRSSPSNLCNGIRLWEPRSLHSRPSLRHQASELAKPNSKLPLKPLGQHASAGELQLVRALEVEALVFRRSSSPHLDVSLREYHHLSTHPTFAPIHVEADSQSTSLSQPAYSVVIVTWE